MSGTDYDPFADASIGGGVATKDAFTASTDVDDPFAVHSELGGGDFTPAAPLESLRGRLVVMIPRSLNPDAPNPLKPGETREVYTVDLTVLTGGELRYYYKVKADPERGRLEETTEQMVIKDVSPENPFTILSYWVPQGGIVGKLKKAHANGQPYLGVPAMVPTKADRDKGVTTAQVVARVDAWIARGRVDARPQYSWALQDPTPEQRAIAVAWWKANRQNIAAIIAA